MKTNACLTFRAIVVVILFLGLRSFLGANLHGDSCDTYSISFEFADGTVMNHSGSHISYPFHVRCVAVGRNGTAEIGYTGNAGAWRIVSL